MSLMNTSVSKTTGIIHNQLFSFFDRIFNQKLFDTLLKSTRSQRKPVIPALLIIYIPTLILLFAAALISSYYNIPISKFTRDPMAIVRGHPFLGIISNIGAILWSSSAAFCFLSYLLLRTREDSRDAIGLIRLGGLISVVLLLDDLFMLHDYICAKYFGINELPLFLLYGMLILFYLVRYIKIIIQTEFLYLILAISFFALSILVDRLPEYRLPMHHLFEDGTKFIGIVSWVSYQFSVCFRKLQPITDTLAPNK